MYVCVRGRYLVCCYSLEIACPHFDLCSGQSLCCVNFTSVWKTKLGRLTPNPSQTNHVCTFSQKKKKRLHNHCILLLSDNLFVQQECRRYLIVVQWVFLDKGLDKFFWSDVTQSLLRRKQKNQSIFSLMNVDQCSAPS